jgi:hypothetical protein
MQVLDVTLIAANPSRPTTIKISNDPEHRHPDAVLLQIIQDPCDDNHYSMTKMIVHLSPTEVLELEQALGMTH